MPAQKRQLPGTATPPRLNGRVDKNNNIEASKERDGNITREGKSGEGERNPQRVDSLPSKYKLA